MKQERQNENADHPQAVELCDKKGALTYEGLRLYASVLGDLPKYEALRDQLTRQQIFAIRKT